MSRPNRDVKLTILYALNSLSITLSTITQHESNTNRQVNFPNGGILL